MDKIIKNKGSKIGPVQAKTLLLLRKPEFADDLNKARQPHGIPIGGFEDKQAYAKWILISGNKQKVIEGALEKNAYEIVNKHNLSRNYVHPVKQCLLYGKNIDPKYIGFTFTTYMGKDPVKDSAFTGNRMLIEVYPETSIDEINYHWKDNRRDARNFFGPQNKFRPYDDLLFDLDVYDMYISRGKNETVQDVVDKINKKYENIRSITYPKVNKIVHKIKGKIASL